MTDEHPGLSPGVNKLGRFIRALVRYGWIIVAAVLLGSGLLDLLAWKTVLVLGIIGAAVIALSPAVFGVIVAVDGSRRLARRPRRR